MSSAITPASEGYSSYLRACTVSLISPQNNVILVDTAAKVLELWLDGEKVCSYPISTARNGIGQESGSGKTPLGLHEVKERIGEGADPFSVFVSRVIDPDKVALVDKGDRYIVGRILRLVGLEKGYNEGIRSTDGVCVDSFERFIYIHGTNHVREIGIENGTAGCICMKPTDIIDLFDKVEIGTHVHIIADSSPY